MCKTTYSFLFTLFVTLVALISCSPAGQEQSVDDNAPANATAVYIDELEILIMESFPVQVSAVVRGNLADGCVILNGLNPVEDMGNWVIEIDNSRDTDTMCTEALVPFVEIVPLDVLGLAAGTYTVTAGEKSATYILDMDNRISDVLPSEVEIMLERTACFGTCPVYTLAIYGDGTVVFTGTDFVEYTGEQTSLLSIDAVSELVGAFVEAGYLDWEDAYTNREVTDLPTVITSIAVDGEFKRIEHYLGDSSAPKELTDLEDLTDATVNSSQWTGR